MLSAVGPGPLLGLCRQQGGSLSLDSIHIMCACVSLCVRPFMSVCICGCALTRAHVQRHCVTVYSEGMETESL